MPHTVWAIPDAYYRAFNGSIKEFLRSIFSDYRQQYAGRFNHSVQSVCRQCFNTCDPSNTTNDGGAYCFGGSG